MNKKKTAITIIVSIILMIIVSCSEINPFFAGGVVPGGNWIYFAEGNDIKRMRLDGKEPEHVFSIGPTDIRGIQLDPFQQKIYISYHVTDTPDINKIYEYDLDGESGKQVADTGIEDIFAIKIDASSGKLYYATAAMIRQISLESGTDDLIYSMGLSSPFSMSPDYNGNIYFSQTNSITKLNISTNAGSPITLTPSVAIPNGLASDRDNNIYFYDGDHIRRFNSTNSNNIDIYNSVDNWGYQNNMEINRVVSKLFFYNSKTVPYELYSINLDGTEVKKIYSTNISIGGFDILSK